MHKGNERNYMEYRIRKLQPNTLHNDIIALAEMIPRGTYEGIYAFPRGGLIIGVYLSHYLGDIPLISTAHQWFNLENKTQDKTLFVDDLVHTGKTMKVFKSQGYDTAALFCKEDSPFEPTYYIHKVQKDIWVRFPYETDNEEPNR